MTPSAARIAAVTSLALACAACAAPSTRAGSTPGASRPSAPSPHESPMPPSTARSPATPEPHHPLLGVSWPSFRRDAFAHPDAEIARIRDVGFDMVSVVPTYAYVGLNRIDHSATPSFDAIAQAIATALEAGLRVVVKPHLDPPLYLPALDPMKTGNVSWRAFCPWRGYFDVDPMSPAYLDDLMIPTLDAIARALDQAGGHGKAVPPVRLELGSELMNSVAYAPDRWARLAARMRKEVRARGLEGRVLLSHNFSHHAEIPEDLVLRMDDDGRAALARYIKSLDAVALSQYMDLTVAVPDDARGKRLPTVQEVSDALLRHERAFRRDILEGALGLAPGEIPPLHIGEFGIGPGGLAHPNLWQVELDDAARRELREAVARAHAGLLAYLQRDETTVRSAVLWVTGGSYDVFGWSAEKNAIPGVVQAYDAFFAARAGDR